MATIWSVVLDAALPATLPLSRDEEARADRFRFPRDAHRYRVAHWALREILAARTGTEPEALTFEAEASGKPRLVTANAPPFNLSHAHDLALVAVADPGEDAALGVDVEYHRPVPEMDGILTSHFAPEEREAVLAIRASERVAAFYRIWTRKEAFVKATGSGVGPALRRFAVTEAPSDVRILRADDYPEAVTAWTICDLDLPGTYSGALVACGAVRMAPLRLWRSSR